MLHLNSAVAADAEKEPWGRRCAGDEGCSNDQRKAAKILRVSKTERAVEVQTGNAT